MTSTKDGKVALLEMARRHSDPIGYLAGAHVTARGPVRAEIRRALDRLAALSCPWFARFLNLPFHEQLSEGWKLIRADPQCFAQGACEFATDGDIRACLWLLTHLYADLAERPTGFEMITGEPLTDQIVQTWASLRSLGAD